MRTDNVVPVLALCGHGTGAAFAAHGGIMYQRIGAAETASATAYLAFFQERHE
jgi:hypothetical protein